MEILTFDLVLMKCASPDTGTRNVIVYRVATSWKSSGFFCCRRKSLNFVYKFWKVLENIR